MRDIYEDHLISSPYPVEVISGEGLSKLEFDDILRLHDFLRPIFREIKVVVYTRDHADSLSSQAQQLVKMGKSISQIRSIVFMKDRKIIRNYENIIGCYDKIFGTENVFIRDFNSFSKNKNDLVSDFISNFLDLNPSEFGIVRVNEGMNRNSIHMLDHLNQKIPLYIDDFYNTARARTFISRIAKAGDGVKFILPGVDWSLLKATVREDAIWLKDRSNGAIDYEPEFARQSEGEFVTDDAFFKYGVQLNEAAKEADDFRTKATILSGIQSLPAPDAMNGTLPNFLRAAQTSLDARFNINAASKLKAMGHVKLAYIIAENTKRITRDPDLIDAAESLCKTIHLPDYCPMATRLQILMN